ncbi:hypothetical protein K456DRAFT_1756637 [Colletotrichum gloeosporioides 23]|nr:hypothetical protein K456DRAFT_1756637 [Colletotrichum gloeosporioides 23]
MVFINIAVNTLATCVFLALPAVGLPPQRQDDSLLARQPLDITVRFYKYTTCGGGGPKRDYSSGQCLSLPESSHGVRIIDRRTGCHLIKYVNGNCEGEGSKIDNTGCNDIGDKWNSLKFKC